MPITLTKNRGRGRPRRGPWFLLVLVEKLRREKQRRRVILEWLNGYMRIAGHALLDRPRKTEDGKLHYRTVKRWEDDARKWVETQGNLPPTETITSLDKLVRRKKEEQ